MTKGAGHRIRSLGFWGAWELAATTLPPAWHLLLFRVR
jgi:hypothetical protein